MISSVKTDIGRHRSRNEDAFYLPSKAQPSLYIVADGMGGHRGGQVASKMAVDEVSKYINNNIKNPENKSAINKIIKEAILIANKKILDFSLKNADLSGMGTTITLALFIDSHIYIGHVGDSRIYIVRDGKMKQLTRDHSVVWELMEEGRLTLDETRTHPMKNVITKALGTDEMLEPDLLNYEILPGDIVVLCSDGLTNMLSDNIIREIVLELNPEDAAIKLINEANRCGGFDNITVGIIRVD